MDAGYCMCGSKLLGAGCWMLDDAGCLFLWLEPDAQHQLPSCTGLQP